MPEDKLIYDFRLLNCFNILTSIKQSVFTQCRSINSTPKQIMEQFETTLFDNMKVLCFKAFKEENPITGSFCKLMEEIKIFNKTIETQNRIQFAKASSSLWNDFQSKYKNLIENYENLNKSRKKNTLN